MAIVALLRPVRLSFASHLAVLVMLFAVCSSATYAQNTNLNASSVTPIHDIQYSTAPNGDSPLEYQVVTTRGVVTAVFHGGFVIAEEAGPWHAITVSTFNYGPAPGHKVQLTGLVVESYHHTVITEITAYQLLSVKKPDHIKPCVVTATAAADEAYESVLVRINEVTVTGFTYQPFTYYDEWNIADLSGSIKCSYRFDYNYFPKSGDVHESVAGIIEFTYGEFKLQPRFTNDMKGSTIPHYALHGTVVTMNDQREIISDGYVEILGDQIIRVSTHKPNHAVIYNVDGYIFPGLIDSHNHPAWNVFGHIPFPGLVPDPVHNLFEHYSFTKRYDWQASQAYDDFTDQYYAVQDWPCPQYYGCQWLNFIKFGELRSLCAGTTTWQGMYSNDQYNEDFALQGVGINNAERQPARILSAVFPLNYSASVWQSLQAEYWERFVVHLSEGTDASSLQEFTELANRGALNDRLAIIHGVALTMNELTQMAQANAHLIWSPKSNVLLYGATANIPDALQAGVNVALAPDWTESGEFDILDELRFAQSYSQVFWNGGISPLQFAEFVTCNAAFALGLQHRIGSLNEGMQADIMVIPRSSNDPYADLLNTHASDVALTVVGGRPMYGNPALMSSFHFLNPFDLDDIVICSVNKTVAWRVDSKYAWYTDMSPESILAELLDAYDSYSPKVAPFLHYDQCTTIPKRGVPGERPLPQRLALEQNFPNPFNPETTIAYTIPVDGDVAIKVYDALGRPVQTLLSEYQSAGTYSTVFSGSDLPSGLYMCTLEAAGTTQSIWMTLLK